MKVWPGGGGASGRESKPRADREMGRAELPSQGPSWHPPCPRQERGMRAGANVGLWDAWRLLPLSDHAPHWTLKILQPCPLALEGLSGVGFRHRLGAEAAGPGRWKEYLGLCLWQARQDGSLSGTLKPGMEDSECHIDRMKSWPRGGYVGEAGLSSGLDCPVVHDRPSRSEHPQIRASPHCRALIPVGGEGAGQ